jgi:hypothetical protein
MKKGFKLSLLLTGLFLITSIAAFAQDPGPDPGGDPDAPIDGGIALLAAAGVAYGVKTLRKNKSEETL